MNEEGIKAQVRAFWNKRACGTRSALSTKYSRQYFDEIEDFRYSVEPEVFSFAQFTESRQNAPCCARG